jgi:hypothetical protein
MDDDTPSVNDLFASVEFCYFGVGMMRTWDELIWYLFEAKIVRKIECTVYSIIIKKIVQVSTIICLIPNPLVKVYHTHKYQGLLRYICHILPTPEAFIDRHTGYVI